MSNFEFYKKRDFMAEPELLTRITLNPQIFGGKPIIRGRRGQDYLHDLTAVGFFALRGGFRRDIIACMVRIKFSDPQTEVEALAVLAGRFSFKSFDDGTTLVPEVALGYLAAQGIRFSAEGSAVYGQIVPTIRSSSPSEVQ